MLHTCYIHCIYKAQLNPFSRLCHFYCRQPSKGNQISFGNFSCTMQRLHWGNRITNTVTATFRQCSTFEVGKKVTLTRRFSEEDLKDFAKLTGDYNPIHLDDKVALSTGIFVGRVVHGALINGFISGILGTKLPGPGTIAFSQEMRFPKPLYIDEEMTAEVTIAAIKRKFLECNISCFVKQSSKVVMSGTATVIKV
uniref:Hydroxyacyl-thioester dehydratase type 2, mitochondrial n=1 Tax=Phallusia mammillata TaxID=59560 RepID=A0A6F9DFI2_9ASCI|nr:hydroxyacyl-thioester dehydratase type 2, mitochondrial [Phallusia mammillata]